MCMLHLQIVLLLMEAAVVSNISLALDVAEKLVGYFRMVLFVAPAAGLLSQGLKEVKDTNNERDRLLARVTCINQDLCATILRMEGTSHGSLLMRLKPDVETYAGLIKRASKHISGYDGHGTFSRVLYHQQLQGELDGLQREFDLFGDRFKTNRLVDLAIQQGEMKGTLVEVYDMVSITYEKVKNSTRRKKFARRARATNNKFIQWRENPGSLRIQGNSIDDLFRDQQFFNDLGKPSAVAFFYFDFKDKAGHTIDRALRHIILQFSASSPYHYRALEEQHKVSNGATLPTYQDLQHIVRALLREIGRTYLVLDALDECSEELGQLMDLILRLHEWDESPLHLLFTSQPWTEFIGGFKDVTSICLDSSVTEADIKLFVDKELRENQKMKTWAPHADEISNRVVSEWGKRLMRLVKLADVTISARRSTWGSVLSSASSSCGFDAFVLVPGALRLAVWGS
ncbi:hypothetical protein B0H13DRAFT_2516560 [Mycena leptocephala]|nr:hypothetical protein B0H13DRAFT_2516560 [Mycena leptocephala]